MNIKEELLLLSDRDVLKLLSLSDAISTTENTFLHIGLGDITVGDITMLYVSKDGRNNFHSMPAILHHKHIAGIKWIDTYADPIPGYPFSHGNIVILSDTNTGSPIAVVGATDITTMRTAGGHGVVQAKYLANPAPEILTVIGCGSQARAGIRGFLTQFNTIREIHLFSRSLAPMEEVRKQLYGQVDVKICSSPAEAVSGSSLILMASGAYEPLITYDMIRPGTTIIGIEGFRDMDQRIGKLADKWFLGYKKPDTDILESPNLNPGHLLNIDDVFGDMTELLTGKIPGREREDEIIVSTHMGMGAHDVACAALAYERARQQGAGYSWLL